MTGDAVLMRVVVADLERELVEGAVIVVSDAEAAELVARGLAEIDAARPAEDGA